jgi:hypothetical protein
MTVDAEVLAALAQAVTESGQPQALESALAAWLKAMGENEVTQGDHRRHLEAAKHATQANAGSEPR